jgi:hypothetical protein
MVMAGLSLIAVVLTTVKSNISGIPATSMAVRSVDAEIRVVSGRARRALRPIKINSG